MREPLVQGDAGESIDEAGHGERSDHGFGQGARGNFLDCWRAAWVELTAVTREDLRAVFGRALRRLE